MIRQKLAAIAAAILAVFGIQTSAKEPLTYGSGYYTNLCGSGAAANVHKCSGECDPGAGVCRSGKFFVARWVCDGKSTECGENESWASSQSLDGIACGKTVSLNVFGKNCRVGGWMCNESDLKDYMVWYSGDCAQLVLPTVSPTAVPTLTPSPTFGPTIVPSPTLKPRPAVTIATPSATIVPVAKKAPETGGGGWAMVQAVAVVGMGVLFVRWGRWLWR